MRFITGGGGGGSAARSYEPMATVDTTDLRYWLHWRVGLCGLWVLACMAVAGYLIWRHEGAGAYRRPGGASSSASASSGPAAGGEPGCKGRRPGVLYDDEAWRPCLRDIHPAWLLAYRLISFFVLLSLLVVIVISDGGSIFYYYTHKFTHENVAAVAADMELGTSYIPHGLAAKPTFDERDGAREIAGFWGYLLQIIYQTNAGAVMLTDCVFWFIIFPFLTMKDYNLNFLLIGMHSVNAVFLLGEAALNSLRFPWFRIAYFFLWTALYVIFQWIVHAATPIWWPYPFLDLTSNLAPLWYLAVAVLQLPCYVVFRLLIKLKHHLLAKWFPVSYVRG
ncbi:unnamed protein product [Miscanthus lutarioriparius]|uniref:Uncharacterized protein n=1 Tax=Miscanthus lutarioriparius TaxID=422564 RepID=A0A811PXA7_9POAL|nr:unnamed protein product [Miscanthus lutarioriparius]